jgi:membrane protein DedA with SNARE-associated domain
VILLAHLASQTPNVPTSGLAGLAADLMDKLGLFGAGLILAIETLLPFLPSEVVLPLAGFTASVGGEFGLVPVIIATTIGSLVGALGLYWVSRLFGRDRTRALLVRIPLVSARDIDRGEQWFVRHGGAAVFFCRMVPVLRSLISVPAGVEKMNVWSFALYTTAGSLIWNSVFIVAGFKLGENWASIEKYAAILQYVVVGAVMLAAAWFVVYKIRTRREVA